MSALANLLHKLGVTQSDLVKGVKLSRSTVSRMVREGEWPARRAVQVRDAVVALLAKRGAKPGQLRLLPKVIENTPPVIATNKLAPASVQPAEAESPRALLSNVTPKEDPMLLQNEALTPEAKAHFGLARSPFVDDVQSCADVYQTQPIANVRAALLDAALNHGFIGVVGESGSGKSTLAEDLEERVKADKRDIIIIRPYVLAMEANDNAGKTLKSSQIAEAIAHALDPRLKVRSSAQARFTQVHELLKASRNTGTRHLLLIEEAHCLPTATLKHLKRFLELKDGMRRTLGVALVAQPELLRLLNSNNGEVREVMQRCELVTLPPLDKDLEGYLRHKLRNSSAAFDAVFAKDAMDAIRQRLIYMPRDGKAKDAQSQCYPLMVNNLVCRAMNAATKAGWPTVDAQVIAKC
jgi:type II secretory pathway predicted ATPase ExeA